MNGTVIHFQEFFVTKNLFFVWSVKLQYIISSLITRGGVNRLFAVEERKKPTVKADIADVTQQLLAVDVAHARAESWASGAQVSMHAVKSMSHGINCIHHKLHLPLLLEAGVPAHFLQT